jgi:UDP-N-acetylmuramate--alanine ligase
MSGVALMLRQRGYAVVGTDPRDDPAKDRLVRAGVAVHAEQDGSRIATGTQIVVATAALRADHPELAAARRSGIRVIKYADMLGALMADADGVAVAGTHGKTTTTAMIVAVLRAAGVGPGYVIGGFVPELGASSDAGTSRVFVAEACEFDRSFLKLSPRRAVITNVEADHLDCYADLAEIEAAFIEFARGLPTDGLLVHSADHTNLGPIAAAARSRKITYSLDGPADYEAQGASLGPEGSRFFVRGPGRDPIEARLIVPGLHNVSNALAAFAICEDLGVPAESCAAALSTFRGASRRFELKGEARGVTIVDDYAHHPTEIRALLSAARSRFPGRRLVVAFQPHQISRTRLLLEEFGCAFDQADEVVLPDIYAARDAENGTSFGSHVLAERIVRHGTPTTHIPALPDLARHLLAMLSGGDVLLTVGAGDIHTVADAVLAGLRARG